MVGFGYADKLTYREDLGGGLGDPEVFEPKDAVESKVEQLAALVRRIGMLENRFSDIVDVTTTRKASLERFHACRSGAAIR